MNRTTCAGVLHGFLTEERKKGSKHPHRQAVLHFAFDRGPAVCVKCVRRSEGVDARNIGRVLVCEQLPVRQGRRGTPSKQRVAGTGCCVLLSCTVLVRTTTHGVMRTVGAKDTGRGRWMSMGIVREALWYRSVCAFLWKNRCSFLERSVS